MRRQLPLTSSLLAIALVILGSSLVASPALADIVGGGLSIIATNDAGDMASFQIPGPPAGVSTWTWSSTEMIEMRSPTTGELIAVLNPDGRQSRVEYVHDPIINLAFAVQSGPSATTFLISSALLSFPVITAPEGRASTGFSLTDGDGDGATLTGVGDPSGAQGAYLAQYNGFAATLSGTTFAEEIKSMTAGIFSTQTASADVPVLGFDFIPNPASDMSVLVSFSLTANDLASGTSTYIIQRRTTLATEAATWGRIKALYR
jgi:hypothetical protein